MSSHGFKITFVLGTALLALGLVHCDSSTRPDTYRDFIVDVNGETLIMRASDPVTVRQAAAVRNGGESMFPIGPLRRGDGGFNAPWSWNLDPDQVRLTQTAAEVCDGLPSFGEENLDSFLRPGVGYCPWSARIVGEASGTGALHSVIEPVEIDEDAVANDGARRSNTRQGR